MASTRLRGMTWSHPRGYDPMVACSKIWLIRRGVEIAWDQRSLQDFESYPVEELARRYDLIVIDHPHVGEIADAGCLAPLDVAGREGEGAALARESVGASYASYRWRGRQWALPIDAATQVQAWRDDLASEPAKRWSDMLPLAREGRVHCPMRPPHSLMTLYTLTANLGAPCHVDGPQLIDPAIGLEAYECIRELIALVDPACTTMDPIAVFEAMAQPGSRIACVPLIYGYVSYSQEGFRPRRLRFADIPVAGRAGPVGSALGGTGIAVSAMSPHIGEAIDFAYWIASAKVQCGAYAASGGQPGNAAAWTLPAVNAPVADFYAATRPTLEGAWLRPRHHGYMNFQHHAAERLNAGLMSGESGAPVIADLNVLFAKSLRAT